MGGADVRGRRRRRPTSSSSRPSSTRSASAGPAFRYALRSEASLRFEKGQEYRLARLGADRTARLIAEWAGGTVAPGVVDTNPTEPHADARRVPAGPRQPPARARRSGPTSSATLLARVGIETEPAAPGDPRRASPPRRKPLEVDAGRRPRRSMATVPTWRRDLAIEADITEEVARVRGYELVPGDRCRTRRCRPTGHRRSRSATRVRETLAGAGLTEVVTLALVAPRDGRAVPGRATTAPLDGRAEQRAAGRPVAVTNPLSSQHSVLRQSLLGSLLEVVATNLRQGRDGRRDLRDRQGLRRDRRRRRPTSGGASGFALTGAAEPPAWNRPARAVRPRRREGRASS